MKKKSKEEKMALKETMKKVDLDALPSFKIVQPDVVTALRESMSGKKLPSLTARKMGLELISNPEHGAEIMVSDLDMIDGIRKAMLRDLLKVVRSSGQLFIPRCVEKGTKLTFYLVPKKKKEKKKKDKSSE